MDKTVKLNRYFEAAGKILMEIEKEIKLLDSRKAELEPETPEYEQIEDEIEAIYDFIEETRDALENIVDYCD